MGPVRSLLRVFYLCVPCGLAIAVPLYNRLDPTVSGFPLFYWFLLILIPFTSLCIYAAYKGDDH